MKWLAAHPGRALSAFVVVGLMIAAGILSLPSGCSELTRGDGANRPKVVISGYVRDEAGNGLAGFVVAATDVDDAVVSNANGFFELRVPQSWSGVVTLHRSCFTFSPENKKFSSLNTNSSDNNFVATPTLPPGGANAGPIARAGADQIVVDGDGDGSESVKLDASGSMGVTAAITKLEWLENGAVVATGLSPTATLPLGTHTITLRVTDDKGATGEDVTAVGVVAFMPARTIFVDIGHPGASDVNAGTESEPLQTIQAAANLAKPGDTVYIKAGSYIRNHPSANQRVIFMQNIHGAQDRPITFASYRDAQVQIVGDYAGADMGACGWEMIDCSWINIKGIEFARFAGTGLDISAKSIGGSHHITVDSCVAHECSQGFHTFVEALRVIGPVRYVVFKNCMVYNSNSGIILREDPIQDRTTCFVPPRAGNNAPGTPPCGYTEDMPESEWDGWEGWTEIAPRYCSIEDCIAFDNSHVAENSDGFGMRYAIDCTIRNNVSFRNGDDNFDMLGATRLIMTNNVSFDANPSHSGDGDGNGMKVGVRGAVDCVVAYNISYNNYRMGLDMGDSERSKVYNNTFVHNGEGHANGFGLWFEGPRAIGKHIVLNNILKDNGLNSARGDFGAEADVRFGTVDYNSISDGNDNNFAGPLGPHSRKNSNPRFANENLAINTSFPAGLTIPQRLEFIRNQVRQKFTLAADSPLIDAGTRIEGINDTFQGAGPDIGAVESH